MIKKLFLSISAAILVVGAYGQAPDYDAIEVAIGDISSPYYYPTLMGRYINGDTTLTREDYRHLYYGYVFQDSYRPLDPVPGETDLLNLLDTKQQFDEEDAHKMLYYAGEVMQRDPFSLNNINFMTYAYGLLGDKEKERISAARLQGVYDAIESTGSGEKEESPWHITSFSHVIDFMTLKGYQIQTRRVVSRSVEYVKPRSSDRKNKGFYFDFSRVYTKPPTVMPVKPKGLKPKL